MNENSTEITTTYAGAYGGKMNVSAAMFRTGIQLYSQQEQETMEWLWGYLNQHLRRQAKLLERELDIPYVDIYAAFTGKPTERFGELLKKAEELKKNVVRHLHIVETPVTRNIIDTLDYTRDYSAMTMICGPTGRGKTYAAQYWAALNNHGRSRYIRMTSSCSRTGLLYQLCAASGTGYRGYKNVELEDRVFNSLTARNVLIIDEAGLLVPRTNSGTGAIELVRDIHDITGCGICMIMTDVYLEMILLGPMKNYFEQFRGRIERTYRIPEKPTKAEVSAVVRGYRKDAPRDLLSLAYESAIKDDGKLRTLFRDLTRAQLLADDENRPMNAEDLQLAIDLRSSGTAWVEDR